MPRLNEFLLIFYHESLKLREFVLVKTAILGEGYRFEPKFRDVAVPLYMNVWRLSAIRTEEYEAVWSDAENSWHSLVF